MGAGWLGWTCNIICIAWTLFVSVLFSLPTYFPVTAENMNYASVITVGVIVLSLCVPHPPLPPIHSPLSLVQKGSGISLGMLPFLQQWEYRLTASCTYRARAHYKGPVSYTDGHGGPTGGSTEDQSDKKEADATVEWVSSASGGQQLADFLISQSPPSPFVSP
jgi:hypothetical protein